MADVTRWLTYFAEFMLGTLFLPLLVAFIIGTFLEKYAGVIAVIAMVVAIINMLAAAESGMERVRGSDMLEDSPVIRAVLMVLFGSLPPLVPIFIYGVFFHRFSAYMTTLYVVESVIAVGLAAFGTFDAITCRRMEQSRDFDAGEKPVIDVPPVTENH